MSKRSLLVKFGTIQLCLVAFVSFVPQRLAAQETSNQLSSEGSMIGVNLNRNRVYSSLPLSEPKSIVWKTGELFVTYDSYVTTLTREGMPGQPKTSGISLPSSHSFTEIVLTNGTVFFAVYNNDGHIFAQDAVTGQDKWRFHLKKLGVTAPAIAGNKVFFGASDGSLYALDATSGAQLWTYKQKGSRFFATAPLVQNGVVYFTLTQDSGDFIARPDGLVIALDAESGELKWVFKTKGALTTPALEDRTLYFGNNDGFLHALEIGAGKEVWKLKVGKGVSSPSIMNGVIYFDDYKGILHAFDINTQTELWKGTKLPEAITFLAVYDDTVFYAGVENGIFAVDAKTGTIKWQFSTTKPCRPPVIAGGAVYSACRDSFIYALDAKTGTQKWQLGTKGTVTTTPAISAGHLYFLAADGHLFSLK